MAKPGLMRWENVLRKLRYDVLSCHSRRAAVCLEFARSTYHTHDSSEVARMLNPQTGKSGLSSSLSWSVGFSIQDEAMDVAWFMPQVSHSRATIIYFFH